MWNCEKSVSIAAKTGAASRLRLTSFGLRFNGLKERAANLSHTSMIAVFFKHIVMDR
jgi:hypothetical protein